MFGAVPDASGAVSVFSVGVRFPGVCGGIVSLHRRALLGADAIVIEVSACQAVALNGTPAASGAEYMAAIAGIGTEASTL